MCIKFFSIELSIDLVGCKTEQINIRASIAVISNSIWLLVSNK